MKRRRRGDNGFFPLLWIGAGTLLVCLFLTPLSRAADWYFTPRFRLSEKYDSNILLKEEDKVEDFVTAVRPEIEGTYRTRRFKGSIASYAEYQKYVEESDLDTVLHNHVATLSYAVLPNLEVRARARFRKDTTLETELTEEGRRFGREDRYKYHGNAGVTYVWSRRLSFQLDGGQYYTRYPDNPEDRSDFHTDTLGWTTNYVWSPKTTVVVSLSYQKSKYDNLEEDTYNLVNRSIENYSVLPQVRYRFAEDFEMGAGFGYRYTRSHFKTDYVAPWDEITPDQTTDTDSDGFIFILSLKKKWERSSLKLEALRDQYSSLDGESVERNRIDLFGRYRVSERFDGEVDLVYIGTTTDGEGEDTDYWSARPMFRFRLRRNMDLRAFFQYTVYNSDSTDTQRIQGGISFNVHWDRLLDG